MTVCLMLILGISLGQGWDRPTIQEAELAAPEGLVIPNNNGTPQRVSPTPESWEANSWDTTRSGDALLTPMDTNAPTDTQESPVKEQEVPPLPQDGEARATPPAPTAKQPRRIVTFWFILPKR